MIQQVMKSPRAHDRRGAVAVGESVEMRDVRRRTYVGLVTAKRRSDCARETKVTLRRKKEAGERRWRRIPQR
jgi:hypothetical protein